MITVIGRVINVKAIVNIPMLQFQSPKISALHSYARIQTARSDTHRNPLASGTVYTPFGPLEALDPIKMTLANDRRIVNTIEGTAPMRNEEEEEDSLAWLGVTGFPQCAVQLPFTFIKPSPSLYSLRASQCSP
jgi:hypothetical protein